MFHKSADPKLDAILAGLSKDSSLSTDATDLVVRRLQNGEQASRHNPSGALPVYASPITQRDLNTIWIVSTDTTSGRETLFNYLQNAWRSDEAKSKYDIYFSRDVKTLSAQVQTIVPVVPGDQVVNLDLEGLAKQTLYRGRYQVQVPSKDYTYSHDIELIPTDEPNLYRVGKIRKLIVSENSQPLLADFSFEATECDEKLRQTMEKCDAAKTVAEAKRMKEGRDMLCLRVPMRYSGAMEAEDAQRIFYVIDSAWYYENEEKSSKGVVRGGPVTRCAPSTTCAIPASSPMPHMHADIRRTYADQKYNTVTGWGSYEVDVDGITLTKFDTVVLGKDTVNRVTDPNDFVNKCGREIRKKWENMPIPHVSAPLPVPSVRSLSYALLRKAEAAVIEWKKRSSPRRVNYKDPQLQKHWDEIKSDLQKNPGIDLRMARKDGLTENIDVLWLAAFCGQWSFVEWCMDSKLETNPNAAPLLGPDEGLNILSLAVFDQQQPLVNKMLRRYPHINFDGVTVKEFKDPDLRRSRILHGERIQFLQNPEYYNNTIPYAMMAYDWDAELNELLDRAAHSPNKAKLFEVFLCTQLRQPRLTVSGRVYYKPAALPPEKFMSLFYLAAAKNRWDTFWKLIALAPNPRSIDANLINDTPLGPLSGVTILDWAIRFNRPTAEIDRLRTYGAQRGTNPLGDRFPHGVKVFSDGSYDEYSPGLSTEGLVVGDSSADAARSTDYLPNADPRLFRSPVVCQLDLSSTSVPGIGQQPPHSPH